MQPYLFPYLGYFQLISAVDKFIFLDDVNYINKGWVNRNRIKINGNPEYFTVPLSQASQSKKINTIKIAADAKWRNKVRQTMHHAYRRAPHFESAFQIFDEVINSDEELISNISKKSIRRVADYLSINTKFINSSSPYENTELTGAARILDICRTEQADIYLNLPGGRHLYDAHEFSAQQIRLCFINPVLPCFEQGIGEFLPGLSIIDLLMHNAVPTIQCMLKLATFEYADMGGHTDQS